MGLETRYKIEEDFHNNWARTIDLDDVLVMPFFESCTSVENKYALEIFGEINGKHILDLGCGAGEASVYFALKGAIVTAADISDEMLKVVEKVAQKYKVKVITKKIIGEKMDISSESFDCIFGNGV